MKSQVFKQGDRVSHPFFGEGDFFECSESLGFADVDFDCDRQSKIVPIESLTLIKKADKLIGRVISSIHNDLYDYEIAQAEADNQYCLIPIDKTTKEKSVGEPYRFDKKLVEAQLEKKEWF